MKRLLDLMTGWRSRRNADRALPAGAGDRPYEVHPTRPGAQLAVRVALWTAVVVGAVGGLAGLLGLTGGDTPTVEAAAPAEWESDLPAPVANAAEQAAQAWLTNQDNRLEELFVEPPGPSPVEGGLEVGPVTTLAGYQWDDGYWLVTLAVEVYECVPPDLVVEDEDEGADVEVELPIDCEPPAADDEADSDLGSADGEGGAEGAEALVPQAATWHLEVGVVGEVERRVAALTTPGVVAAPEEVPDGWQTAGRGAGEPEAGEPVAEAAEGFLRAWLTGEDDISRYLAPGVEVDSHDPAPFTEVALEAIAYDELEPGHVRTSVQVQASTPGGAQVVVSYEVVLTFRADRWEVTEHWGAPTLTGRP